MCVQHYVKLGKGEGREDKSWPQWFKMEAFLPAFLAQAHQPYRKKFIKDHIEIKAYCKREKKFSVQL